MPWKTSASGLVTLGRTPRGVLLWPALLFGCGVALSSAAGWLQHRVELEGLRESIRNELVPSRGELSREVFGAVHLTEGLASVVAVDGEISEEKFRALTTELFRRSDLVRNVALAPDNVVTHVYPLEGNERVIGLDYAKSREQWPSVERMMNEGGVVVAGPVPLVQGGMGVIGRTPIFLAAREPSKPRRYWGLVSTVVAFDRLLATTSLEAMRERLRVGLRGVDGLGARGAPFWGDPHVFDAEPVVVEVPLPSGSWQLGATPRGGWPPFRALGSSFFLAGALVTVVLSGLLRRLLQTSHAREQEVRLRQSAIASLERAHAELEERVAARTADLRLARDAAQSADRLKSAFLATMSHELRTPLNSIIGFSGILLQRLAGPLTEEQEKQLRMVRGSADHLLALITDVLDLSRIEAGQLRLSVAPFDLRACIEKAAATVGPVCEKKGLALELEIAPDVGVIEGDRRRVEQVLLNLLSNAIKFTDEGRVRVQASCRDDTVTVAVSDTGIGIDRDAHARLFVPFSQLEVGLDRRHEGTGLGLSICKRLVELLGGTIWIKSEAGRGSTFGFDLPRRHASVAPSDAPPRARSEEPPAP